MDLSIDTNAAENTDQLDDWMEGLTQRQKQGTYIRCCKCLWDIIADNFKLAYDLYMTRQRNVFACLTTPIVLGLAAGLYVACAYTQLTFNATKESCVSPDSREGECRFGAGLAAFATAVLPPLFGAIAGSWIGRGLTRCFFPAVQPETVRREMQLTVSSPSSDELTADALDIDYRSGQLTMG